jgi:hypothetical protein
MHCFLSYDMIYDYFSNVLFYGAIRMTYSHRPYYCCCFYSLIRLLNRIGSSGAWKEDKQYLKSMLSY